MKIKKDPENIGWAGCIDINRDTKEILAVKSTKRQAQIDAEIKKRDWHPSRKATWMITGELARAGTLEKADKFGPAGGKIAYWAGNEKLQATFRKFTDNGINPPTPPDEITQFIENSWKKVLFDDDLLLQAADATADSECVEELGLIVKEKTLLFKIEDEDRDNSREAFPEMFYPRFWYLVKSVKTPEEGGGILRTEPIKNTISEPRWIPLMKLHPFKSHPWKREDDIEEDDAERLYRFHPVHVEYGVIAAVKYFIAEGDESFVKVLEYLEGAFGKPKPIEKKHESWEDIMGSTQKL